MINIKELARLANVSKSTVSKALNNRPDIGEETKQKILKIAREHNFTPNAIAKGLSTSVTENIGIIFRREERSLSGNPFYSRVLEGIEEAALTTDYNLLLHLVPDTYEDLPDIVRKRQVDGLLLIGTHNPAFVECIRNAAIPMVAVDPGDIVEGCHHVLIDNEKGAYLAAQYLIKCGHRRIGFIGGELKRRSFQLRLDGYKRALTENGIPIREELIECGKMEEGPFMAKNLMRLPEIPTAIFASHDIKAIQACKVINEMGLNVPKDVSVIGFDNIDLSLMVTPNISTIHVRKKKLGSIALQMLQEIMSGKVRAPLDSLVPVKLIERDSVRRIEARSV